MNYISSFKIHNVEAYEAVEEIRKQAAENDSRLDENDSVGPTGPAGTNAVLDGNTGSFFYANGPLTTPQTFSQGPTGSMILSRGPSSLPVYGGGGYVCMTLSNPTSLANFDTLFVEFDNVRQTNNQFFVNDTDGSLTVSNTGLYMYSAYALFGNNPTGNRSIAMFFNNSEFREFSYPPAPTKNTSVQISDIIYLQADTVITMRVQQDSGTTLDLLEARLSVYNLNV